MKARIKATGEIAEFSTGKNLQGEIILLKVGTASVFSLNEVELIHDIDWQQVRIQAAIAAMQGMLAGDTVPHDKALTISAVELADVLVGELKKGSKQ